MGVVWIFKEKEGASIEDVTNELIKNKLDTNGLESILLMVLNNKDYDKKFIMETLEKL